MRIEYKTLTEIGHHRLFIKNVEEFLALFSDVPVSFTKLLILI